MLRLLRELSQAWRIACGALRANPARGVLTTLGIIIGILGVSTTMTAVNGLADAFHENLSVLGSDVLYVTRFPWVMDDDLIDFRNRPRLTLHEAARIAERLPETAAINPTTQTSRGVKYGTRVLEDIDIVGTTDKQMLVLSGVPEFGHFLTALDVHHRRQVCVIGHGLRERLFGDVDPLNQRLRIGRHHFRVVGIMEKQGNAGLFGGPDFDSQIYVPITTLVKVFGGAYRNMDFAVKAPVGVALEEFEYALVGEIRKIRRLAPEEADNFAVVKLDSILEVFNNVMAVVLMIGTLITGISLFVGGIGVMNIMFVAVTERTREIGLRKAVGARRRAIRTQFLVESSLICLMGGCVGLALAFAATSAVNRLLLPAHISPTIVLAALGVSALVGVVSGFIPALRASRLDPIEALRHE